MGVSFFCVCDFEVWSIFYLSHCIARLWYIQPHYTGPWLVVMRRIDPDVAYSSEILSEAWWPEKGDGYLLQSEYLFSKGLISVCPTWNMLNGTNMNALAFCLVVGTCMASLHMRNLLKNVSWYFISFILRIKAAQVFGIHSKGRKKYHQTSDIRHTKFQNLNVSLLACLAIVSA